MRAGQTRNRLAILAVVTAVLLLPASVAAAPGWGPKPAYLGRYHVTPAGRVSAPAGTPAAGPFSLALAAAQSLATAGDQPTGGELTMFLRKYKGMMLPSGILSLRTASGNLVLFLTKLSSQGSTRAAKVNQSAFVGPVIGGLSGRTTGPASFTATVSEQGLPSFKLNFSRFSANPAP